MEHGRAKGWTTPATPAASPASALRARARLAVATLLLATVPVALGAWVVADRLGGRERAQADARLQESLGSARAGLAARLGAAERRARALAAEADVQRAVLTADRRAGRALVRRTPGLVLRARGSPLAGSPSPHGVVRSVAVIGPAGGVAGSVGVDVPVGPTTLARLQRSAPTPLLLIEGARVVAGPFGVFERIGPLSAVPAMSELGSRRYRTAALALPGNRAVVAAVPASEVESAAASRTRDVALAALATLVTILIAAEAFVPLFRRGRHAEDEESLEVLGAALAAAHDREMLLPIALESLVEATGAVGGVLIEGGEETARVGETSALASPLTLRLARDNGASVTASLYPPAGGFSRATRRRAEWFAAQVVVALESARQHEIAALQAVTDSLTGLANRRRFAQQLALEAERSARSGRPVALIAADLDDFKRVNDRFGHDAGDDVLRAFARVLRGTVREIDVVARLGGEEFAVLLPETDADGAAVVAERLRTRLADLRLAAPGGDTMSVTASFGCASSPPVERVADLPAAADDALYRAKGLGKNRVVEAVA